MPDESRYYNNPYNFVPLNEKVLVHYSSTEDLPHQGQIQDDLLSGTIQMTITAETPLSISDGADGFFRNAGGQYVIPGSTIKGMVRSNMQILGFGALRPGEDFNDVNMLYRLVAPKRDNPKYSLKGHYISALGAEDAPAPNYIPSKVKSGYLVQSASDRKYRLYPARCWRIGRKGHVAYDWRESFAKEQKVSYELSLNDQVSQIQKGTVDSMLHGTLLSPGSAPRSPQSVYLIPKQEPGRLIAQISQSDIERYQEHYAFLVEKYTAQNEQNKQSEQNAAYLDYWKLPVLDENPQSDTEPWFVFYRRRDDGSYAFDRIKFHKDAVLGVLVQRASDRQYVLCKISSRAIQRNQYAVTRWKDVFAQTFPVSYQDTSKLSIMEANRGKRQNYKAGTLFCPDKELASNPHYLFEACDLDCDGSFLVSDSSIQNYLTDFELRKNTLHGTERNMSPKYWELPTIRKSSMANTEPWPVFYRETGSTVDGIQKIDFGRSAYLRVQFDKALGDGVPPAHIPNKNEVFLDYPYSILGFSWKHPTDKKQDFSYKSRVSFGDCVSNTALEKEKIPMILGEPKPTSFADYSVKGKDYNQEGFRIRGIKQYWLKEEQHPTIEKNKEKVTTNLTVVPAGTVFQSSIRFHNLKEDELGLLLWCLKLDKDCYQTIGKGKPYGYGRAKVQITSVERDCPEALYSAASLLPETKLSLPLDVDELIEQYQQNEGVQKFLRGQRPDQQDSVKDLMYIHRVIRDANDVRYITLNEYRFRASSEILPTIEKIRTDADEAEEKRAAEEKKTEKIENGSMDDWKRMLAQRFNASHSANTKTSSKKKKKR
jgi:CRISPR-associated protein (TIGR03986 family)